jgi:8-oxo-dGTP diphosphatase
MIEMLRRVWYDFYKGGEIVKRTENVELTVLCLIYRDGKVLLQNRVKADWRGYALPGGHVEPGESFVEAVIREMKEETGLTISDPKLCGVKQFPIDGGRYVVFLFKTDRFAGELHSSHEGKMEWIPRDGIKALETVAHLEELISVMERDDMTEFRYIVNGGDWIPVLR